MHLHFLRPPGHYVVFVYPWLSVKGIYLDVHFLQTKRMALACGQASSISLLVAHVRGYLSRKGLTTYSNFFSSLYEQASLVLGILESMRIVLASLTHCSTQRARIRGEGISFASLPLRICWKPSTAITLGTSCALSQRSTGPLVSIQRTCWELWKWKTDHGQRHC